MLKDHGVASHMTSRVKHRNQSISTCMLELNLLSHLFYSPGSPAEGMTSPIKGGVPTSINRVNIATIELPTGQPDLCLPSLRLPSQMNLNCVKN